MANNYTLGRGELYFAKFLPGTQNPGPELYFGNSPEFGATIESENLDHYNSDRGIREKDASIVLEVNRTASFTTDNISPDNIAFFFFGLKNALAVAGYSVSNEILSPVNPGYSFQLGMNSANPTGVRGINPTSLSIAGAGTQATGTVTFSGAGTEGDTVTVGSMVYTLRNASGANGDVTIGATADDTAANLNAAINKLTGEGVAYGTGTPANPDASATVTGAVVTLTARTGGTAGNSVALTVSGSDLAVSGATLTGGTGSSILAGRDYVFNPELGRIDIPTESQLPPNSTLDVSYTVDATTRERIISGSAPVEGALRYISHNPAGRQFDWYMPWVKLTPNGDYALKGDEWQTIPFSVEILRKGNLEAIYVEGRPLSN